MAAKARLDSEVAGRVRAVQAEQVLATELSKRADLLRQLSACVELREELLARKAAGDPVEEEVEGECVTVLGFCTDCDDLLHTPPSHCVLQVTTTAT